MSMVLNLGRKAGLQLRETEGWSNKTVHGRAFKTEGKKKERETGGSQESTKRPGNRDLAKRGGGSSLLLEKLTRAQGSGEGREKERGGCLTLSFGQ